MKRLCAATLGLALLAPALTPAGVAVADPALGASGYGQPIDNVIQRALSARGIPFVYGGGNVAGPTTGARPGTGVRPVLPGGAPAQITPGIASAPATPGTVATPGLPGGTSRVPGTIPGSVLGAAPTGGTVGFDASGLIQYAYAGAGIKMPRTSGEQCAVGRKVAPAQARPGDLLCYGPAGTQSVAMYLGNNQMIEGTEPAVTVSPARTSNMVPYLTRVIGS